MRERPLDFTPGGDRIPAADEPQIGHVESSRTQFSAESLSPPAVESRNSVPVSHLPNLIEEWILDCECRQHSDNSNATRRVFTRNLCWFLHHRQFENCSVRELKQFFHYLARGHEEKGGRWGKDRFFQPLRPVSIKDYYACLRSFFGWMVAEEILESSPMERIQRPPVREEVKQPLGHQQIQALLRAARLSKNPERDEAILMLLLDSGVRANELVQLKIADMDVRSGTFLVTGKGNKIRTCYFGQLTRKVLLRYLRTAKLSPDSPLFVGSRGSHAGKALTRSGLLQLLERLGHVAEVPVNVHQMRRTFATNILQNGSNIVAVRDMLGHTSISMTLKYLSVAQSHIEEQHRKFSPGDKLRALR